MQTQSFLKHAGVYAFGDFLVMAAGFILLPIYTRCLSVAEFGTLEVLERVGEIAAICLVARGIPLAVVALYRQSQSEEERQQVLGAAVLLAALSIGIGSLALALLAVPVGTALQLDNAPLLWTATVGALIDGMMVVGLAANQARLESGFYVAVSFAQFVGKLLLCILFVVGLGWGVWGLVAASLIRSISFTAILLGRECWRGIAWPEGKIFRQAAAFVLPFVPTGLCFFVLNSGDRFFLVRQAGQDQVGIYGLGYRLATLVGLFTMTPLYRVWSARMHDVSRDADAAEVFGRVTTYLLAAYLFVGLGLSLLADEVIAVFAGKPYAAAGLLVPVVVLAYWFQGASVLFDAGFYVRRQTFWKLWIALASTVVMFVLYAVLIPPYGPLGAALATLAGFVFHAGLTHWFAQRVFPVHYEIGRLTVLLLLACLLWGSSRLLGSGLALVPLKLGLLLLWPVLLWVTGVLSPAEKQQLRNTAAQVWGREASPARERPEEVAEVSLTPVASAPASPRVTQVHYEEYSA
jgi:O-antigen/teichoic acid export membrane protein